MDFFNNLMGGGQRQDEYRDFTNRYDQGALHDRISEEEAASRYREVAPNMSEGEYGVRVTTAQDPTLRP